MGCILSCFKNKDKKDELNKSLLIITPKCFVCDKTFSNLNEYNKHIINCNLLYQKNN